MSLTPCSRPPILLPRSHLKNAKSLNLYASCCSAEGSSQQNSLDEFPISGREFITTLRRPLRGVGPLGWMLDFERFFYF